MHQNQCDWRSKYTEEEVEIAYEKWKKLYRPSSTEEPDHAYIFHTALMENDISKKHLWKVANRLRDRYRRDILKGVRKTITLEDGKKVRRWFYENDWVMDDNYGEKYYDSYNKKSSKTTKTF